MDRIWEGGGHGDLGGLVFVMVCEIIISKNEREYIFSMDDLYKYEVAKSP